MAVQNVIERVVGGPQQVSSQMSFAELRQLAKRPALKEAALSVVSALLIWYVAAELDAFERLYDYSRAHDDWELDEFFILGVCLSVTFAIFFVRRTLQLRREVRLREQAEQTAHTLARHDVLTGLPNRRVFDEALRKACEHAERAKTQCALLILDLNRFKPINDIYGHAAGDIVLQVNRETYSRL